MTIYGTAPLEGENAARSYGTAILMILRRITEWLDDRPDMDVGEPEVMGFVVALRVLAEAEPTLASASLFDERIDELRDRYLGWFEAHKAKVRVKRGVDKGEMARRAQEEFDRILTAIREG